MELGSVHGGYVQLFYNYKCDTYCLNIFPYVRMQEYFGGQKLQSNAPRASVRETELGLEYQFNRALELTVAYSWTQRTSGESATLPVGHLRPFRLAGLVHPDSLSAPNRQLDKIPTPVEFLARDDRRDLA